MNDLKKFNADAAQSFADAAKKKYDEKIKRMANKYIRIIDSKYEKKIKKAVSKDPSVRSIDINLPKFNGPVNIKEADLVEKEINEKLKERGFSVTLKITSCSDCVLRPICPGRVFYASLSW